METSKFYWLIIALIFSNLCFSQTKDGSINPKDYIITSQTMHVHFDKDIYLPGETIWFKAYLYDVNEISYAATNFYAAVYDESGKLLQQKQYPVIEGCSNGDFKISDTIQSSRLRFRAFTKAMIKDDSSNIYEKVLTVYNKEGNINTITSNKEVSLNFFPEGGRLVAELQNYIVFKAIYPDGGAARISGQIIEVETKKVVDSFFTDHLGLGKFFLIPAPRKKYVAKWKVENGVIMETPLPEVYKYGVSFHVEIVNKELQYTIAKNRSSDTLSILHLIGQMGNYKVYKADLVLPNEMEMSTAKFSIDSVPSGLLQLTLLDKYWNPLQERVIFINSNEVKQEPFVIRDTITDRAKAKNTIEIILPDTMYNNLSASIADINFYSDLNTHSIKQDLLFNTQIKNIKLNIDSLLQSGYSNTLDIITLAHEWRKYNWNKVTDKGQLESALVDDYISLYIEFTEKKPALPEGDALNLIVTNKGMDKQFYSLKPVNGSVFRKSGLIFFDSAKISYQMNNNKNLVNYLTINREEIWQPSKRINALPNKINYIKTTLTTAPNYIETFANRNSSKLNDTLTIKGVVVKSRSKGNPELARIEELDNIYATGMFRGTVKGYQLNVLDDPMANASEDVASYVAYRVPGVKIEVNEFTHEKYFVFEESVSVGKKQLTPIPMFLDELQVESVGYINLADVAYIKYIPGIVIGGSFRSTIGAIYVYTKKGNEAAPVDAGMRSVKIKGYDLQKQFTIPGYDSNQALLTEPDFRTTLYWNPGIVLDKTDNKVRIEYYNNDVSKKLLLVIEGVNQKGQLIHIEKVIE